MGLCKKAQAARSPADQEARIPDRKEDRMHHSRLSTFVIDCRSENADEAARFWSAALGRPIESADGNYRQLAGTADEPILLVQKVDHPGRIHLDIETDDMEAEVKRLEGLGARRVAFVKTVGDGGPHWPALLRGQSAAGAAGRARERMGPPMTRLSPARLRTAPALASGPRAA